MLHLIMTLLVHGVYMESATCPESCSCIQTIISDSPIIATIENFDSTNIGEASLQKKSNAYQSDLNLVDISFRFNDTHSLFQIKKCGESNKDNLKDILKTINFKSQRKKRTLKLQAVNITEVNQTILNVSQNISKSIVTEKPFENKDAFTYQVSCSGLRDLKSVWIQHLPTPTTKLNIQKTNFQSFKAFQQILRESSTKLSQLTFLSVSNSVINQKPDRRYFTKTVSTHIEGIPGKKNRSEFLPFASIQSPKLRPESDVEYYAYEKCKNLQILNLTNNTILYLPQNTFYPFINLRVLNLSNNLIEFIDNKAFSSLVNLLDLDLHNNQLQSLNEIIFKNLTKLVFLDVSRNQISNIEPSTFQYLVSLNVLILANNPLSEKQKGIVLLSTGKRLQLVDISKTGLKQIPGTLERSVRVLNLKGNLLLSIRCGDLDSYSLLAYLNLEGNKISYIEDDALGRLEFLKNLQIGNNNLFQAPKILPNNLEILNLSYNNIQSIKNADFLNLFLLKELYLNYNQITSIEENAFNNLVHLEVLNLSRNPIVVLPTIYGRSKLIYLDLSYFTSIPGNYSAKYKQFPLQSPQSVKQLNLEASPVLTKIFLQDTKTLELFTSLEILNLRFSNLTTIRKDIFNLLPKLKLLKVEGNPWHCGKEILALSVWLRSHEYYESSINENEVNTAHCLTPLELYKTNLISLEEKNYEKSSEKTDKSINQSITSALFNSKSGGPDAKLENEPNNKSRKKFSELLPINKVNIVKCNCSGVNNTSLSSNNISVNIINDNCCESIKEKFKSLKKNSVAAFIPPSKRESTENDLNKTASFFNEQSFISWSNSSIDSKNLTKNLTLREVFFTSHKKAEAVTAKDINDFKTEYDFHLNFLIFSSTGLVLMAAVTFISFYFTRKKKDSDYQRQNQDIEVCSISSLGNELW